jgi:hypothetical protein
MVRRSPTEASAEADMIRTQGEHRRLAQACAAELMLVNDQLRRKIDVRRQVERVHLRLIEELRDALKEKRDASGPFPICSRCREMRSDDGHGSRITALLGEYMLLNIVGSICPECANRRTRKSSHKVMHRN